MDRESIIVVACLVLVTLLFFGALVNALLELSRCHRYEKITAEIIDVEERVSYERHSGMVHYYRPTYCYKVDDVVYESQSSCEYSDRHYSVGDIEVLNYDINNPQKYVARGEEYWKRKVHKVIMAICIWIFLLLFMYLKTQF